MSANGPQHAASQPMGLAELVRLRPAQLDDREFGCDEEAVQEDERKAQQRQ